MIRQPDAEGKYPLSGREYYALRQLFGIASGFETTMGALEDRAKLIPGTWRDMKMISSVSDKAITAIVKTIPVRKLQHILTELKNTVVSVEVRGGAGLPVSRREPFCYAPEKSIELLIQNTLEWQCFACQKSPKEAKKCPYRKAIDDVFPYEQPGDTPELCKYSGLHGRKADGMKKKNRIRRIVIRVIRTLFWAIVFILAFFALVSGVVHVNRC